MLTKQFLEEVNNLLDAFKSEQKRYSLASFRRMRKLTLELEKKFKEFRKNSPKTMSDLKSFLESE